MNLSPIIKQNIIRKKIELKGYIQGIGFRPFVYKLAHFYSLTGFVLNESGKLSIEVQGEVNQIEGFLKDLIEKKPKLSKVDSVITKDLIIKNDENDFRILSSRSIENEFSDILPDIALCEDCKKELLHPENPRYFYPFINCTNCGPRYSIIKDHPYDRINTTMNEFSMCDDCKKEYNDPLNRRFHAEPISCHRCGPIYIIVSKEEYQKNQTNYPIYLKQKFKEIYKEIISKNKSIQYNEYLIDSIIEFIHKGYIVAIKGLGGYHLACDPHNVDAVEKLRNRKKRKFKPFAIMFPDIESIKEYSNLNKKQKELLISPQAPIVLLKAKKIFPSSVIPQPQNYIGVFLPYTPIHYLLMHRYKKPLIMTSANFSDEPIVYQDEERIFDLADVVITHNRNIHIWNDDSVLKTYKNHTIKIRNSRGCTPFVMNLKHSSSISCLGLGAQLKNTISILHKNKIISSHSIGDLSELETFESFKNIVNYYKKIYYFEPDYVVVDFHPNYENTKWALTQFPKNKIIFVQHHHAHIASCMFENHLQNDVIGIALDGTGYGITENHPRIVGGEIYLANYKNFQHLGSLYPLQLCGGEKSIKEVDRLALSILYEIYKLNKISYSFGDWLKNFNNLKHLYADGFRIQVLSSMLEKNINLEKTTSCGRLFDGISSLSGICLYSDYEAHSAIALEQTALTNTKKDYIIQQSYPYSFFINPQNSICYLDWRPMISHILQDIEGNKSKSYIALKFHYSIAKAYSEMLLEFCKRFHIKEVVFSGGCFQNVLLLHFFERFLKTHVNLYFHKELSPNDSSISMGQILVATAKLNVNIS